MLSFRLCARGNGNPTDLIEHLVTFIEHKNLDATKPEFLLPNKSVHSPRRRNNYVWVRVFVGKSLNVLGHRSTTVKDGRLDSGHVFAEALVLVLDLICQLPRVTHHEYRAFTGDWFHLLKCREDEDSSLSKTRLGLT